MSIAKYFTQDSFLPSVIPGYRFRQAQAEAAEIIYGAFASFENAVIEAPTGSGKTMAYLVPSFESGKKIIIATKTKQLMSQLLYKDVPALRKIFGEDTAVRPLKGRKNYFCPRRFFKYVIPNAAFYAEAVNWFEENAKKNIREAPWGKLDNDVCGLMTADRYQCQGSKCPYFTECPFYLERASANEADIIITNHHLLLSDMALKSSGSQTGIFEFRDHAVFDEAHAIPDIYPQYAGTELSLFGLLNFFKENKDVFSFSDIDKIQEIYFKTLVSLTESKCLYKEVREAARQIISLGEETVKKSGSKDLEEEYKRYSGAFAEIEGEKEGLRLAEKADPRLTIKFIPFETGESFASGLKQATLSSVFISATMSAGGNFDYFIKETGLSGSSLIEAALPPAFDLKRQGRLYVPTASQCRDKEKIYLQFACGKGSVLIICNSLERMRRVGEALKGRAGGKPVFFQTDIEIGNLDISKDMILVGSASLREGIDLSGGGFRCVILDKLPFEYFKDLLLEARAKKVQKDGGNAFKDFFLPRAALYFKQAAGRLIRHEEDRGVWAVLDERILSEKYGKYFLNVLDNVEISRSAEEALNFIEGELNG